MVEVLVVGGGVIGLSLAYELARHGIRVQLIDRADLGREASWAGAGILPPGNRQTALHPYDQLRGLSFELHAEWAERLLAETGIDNGYRRCGGLYVAQSAGEAAALRGLWNICRAEQIGIRALSVGAAVELEPALANAAQAGQLRAAYALPDECQIRNPRHLRALIAACRQCGVDLLPNVEANAFVIRGERLEGIQTTAGVLRAERYAFSAGAWTQRLLAELGVQTGILPMRGQMLLYQCDAPPISRILNVGNRYLVPREDGRVLVGSTEEEVGFDKRTTAEGLAELANLASRLIPALTPERLETSWAGLRPATFDGLPYIGQIPGLENAFAAAGHFRSGLYLSPGTAVVLVELIRGMVPQIDLAPFRVGRG